MVRKLGENGESLYHISCSDWEAYKLSTDEYKAAGEGLREAYGLYGKDLNLSTLVTVVNCSDFSVEDVEKVEIKIFEVPTILRQIGEFELANVLEKLI